MPLKQFIAYEFKSEYLDSIRVKHVDKNGLEVELGLPDALDKLSGKLKIDGSSTIISRVTDELGNYIEPNFNHEQHQVAEILISLASEGIGWREIDLFWIESKYLGDCDTSEVFFIVSRGEVVSEIESLALSDWKKEEVFSRILAEKLFGDRNSETKEAYGHYCFKKWIEHTFQGQLYNMRDIERFRFSNPTEFNFTVVQQLTELQKISFATTIAVILLTIVVFFKL